MVINYLFKILFNCKEPRREDLPKDVQFKYKELDQELVEGDITDKGYKKKRMKLVHPYLVAGLSFVNVKTNSTQFNQNHTIGKKSLFF